VPGETGSSKEALLSIRCLVLGDIRDVGDEDVDTDNFLKGLWSRKLLRPLLRFGERFFRMSNMFKRKFSSGSWQRSQSFRIFCGGRVCVFSQVLPKHRLSCRSSSWYRGSVSPLWTHNESSMLGRCRWTVRYIRERSLQKATKAGCPPRQPSL
jgi:hypothetical protein